jgi:DNA-binding transcriptional ArsR family regulator
MVLRVHFTVEDLARLRMVASLGPVAEAVFAIDLFGRRSGGPVAEWRRGVRRQLGQRLGAVESVAHTHRPLNDLLWLIGWPGESSGGLGGTDPVRRQVATTMYEFCRVAVVPHWSRARNHLEGERDSRARISITSGVESMLSTLHPKVRWNPPVLEIADAADGDIYLSGGGLQLSPALFLHDRTCVVVPAQHGGGPPTVVFSTPAGAEVLADLAGTEEQDEQALGALVGYTRAAALQALTDSCTTGELSQRLGISLAGASKHARVLRQAGLVITARHRNTATHSLTPLGIALLRNSVHIGSAVLEAGR